MARRKRPFFMTAIALWVATVLLTLPALGELFNGVPLDQSLGSIGFVVGPLLAIGGILLFLVKKPEPGRAPEPLD